VADFLKAETLTTSRVSCSIDWRRMDETSISTWPATTVWRLHYLSWSTGHVTAPSDAWRKWRHDGATMSVISLTRRRRRASHSAPALDWSVVVVSWRRI